MTTAFLAEESIVRILDEFSSTFTAIDLFFETTDVFNYHVNNTSAWKQINVVLE
jgi:hypothetical protein